MERDNLIHLRKGLEDKDRLDKREARHSRRRFAVALASSFLFLAVFLILAVSSNVGSLSVAGVGGLVIQGEEIVGNNLQAYPHPTETAACFSNSSRNVVGSRSEVAAGALKADVSQLRIPADKQVTLIKDIKTPDITGIGTFRFKVERKDLINNPDYPPKAGLGAATGVVPGSYLDGVRFAGIDVNTGINDGYADLTFERTRNITEGESIELTVTAEASYDYSQVDLRPYTFTSGRNPDRFVSYVGLQGLSNPSGDDGGYGVYSNLNNAPGNISTTGTGPTLSVSAETQSAAFIDAIPPNDPDGLNSNAYINDVEVDAITNTGNGNDFGYEDYTNLNTSQISRKGEVTLSVTGNKISPAFGYSQAPDPQNNYGSNANEGDYNACAGGGLFDDDDCAEIQDVEFRGIDRNSGDDNGYYPDSPPPQGVNDPVEPGESYFLTVEGRAEDDGQTIGEDATISIGKAWIDWDQDGVMQSDEEYFLGGVSATEGDEETYRQTIPVLVPGDAQYGTTVLRVINAMCKECNNGPDSSFPASVSDSNRGNYDITQLEVEDYTVDVAPRNDVDAWIDWNQDEEFSETERIDVGESLDRTGTYSYSTDISPPADALSGSSVLRIKQFNDVGNPTPTNSFGYDGETEDYTFRLEENTNSAAHAFIDWNQNGNFDTTVREQEDFSGGSLSGWSTNGDASPETDISNSESYSVNISAGSTTNSLTSPTISEAGDAGAVRLEFWVARGSGGFGSDLPEDGEDLVVEYRDDTGTWQKVRQVRGYQSLAEGDSTTIEVDITDPDALHSSFQVRFRGDGDGTNGNDYWHVDDPVISTTTEAQRVGTSILSGGEYTDSSGLVVPRDAKAGSTLMRIVHKQDGYFGNYPSMATPPGTDFQGEAEDYTVHVERDTSFVRAWIDWNRDGDFDFDAPEEEVFVGQKSAPGNQDRFTVNETVQAPTGTDFDTGPAVLRVKHEQAQRQTDLTGYSVDGFRGENEDYTVILSDKKGDISDTGNLTLGDSSLVLTNLTAENLDLSTALIDEGYADNTLQNPRFGPAGEFIFSGDKLRITNATGILHQASFSIFNIPEVSLTLEYNPDDSKVKANDACPINSYQP